MGARPMSHADWKPNRSFGMLRWVRKINGRNFTIRMSGNKRNYRFVCTHPDGWVLADGPTADAVMLQADLVIQHALEGTIV